MTHTINDFKESDEVYHLSDNSELKRIVIGIKSDINKVTCQWLDKYGKTQEEDFNPLVLEKFKKKPKDFFYVN